MTRWRGLTAAVLGFGAVAGLAQAWDRDGAIYPAAQCAAFWLGRHDYAVQSGTFEADPTDIARGEAFRAAAVRLSGGASAEVDAYVAEQRPMMVMMFDAMIWAADETSGEIHDDLLATCAAFGATQPETTDLP